MTGNKFSIAKIATDLILGYAFGFLSQKIQGPETVITTADGVKLHNVAMGAGDKTVVLAHGYGFTMD